MCWAPQALGRGPTLGSPQFLGVASACTAGSAPLGHKDPGASGGGHPGVRVGGLPPGPEPGVPVQVQGTQAPSGVAQLEGEHRCSGRRGEHREHLVGRQVRDGHQLTGGVRVQARALPELGLQPLETNAAGSDAEM